MKATPIAFALAAMCFAQSAAALPSFPVRVQEVLDTPCAPECTLCHASTSGGGPVVTVFGEKALSDYKLDESVETALTQMEADDVDSDGDGTPDITELRAGEDPNAAGNAPLCSDVKYGCGASIAPRRAGRDTSAWGLAAAVATALTVSAARRRRPLTRR